MGDVYMMKDATQFSINVQTKNRLDALKVKYKDDIMLLYKKKKRFISNTDIINFLLDAQVQSTRKSR